MKVVRLKKGYRISLTDSDFGALTNLVGEAEAGDIEAGLIEYFEPAEKAAYRKRYRAFLAIDEDRRK